jgi:hypothetical protein
MINLDNFPSFLTYLAFKFYTQTIQRFLAEKLEHSNQPDRLIYKKNWTSPKPKKVSISEGRLH